MRTILMLVIMLSAFAFSTDEMEIKVKNITVHIPAGWMAQYTNSAQLFYLFSPIENQDTFQENCNLVMDSKPKDFTQEKFVELSIQNIKNSLQDVKVVENGENWHIFTLNFNGVQLKQYQVYYFKGEDVYIFTFSSTVADFNRYFPIFKSINSTIKIE